MSVTREVEIELLAIPDVGTDGKDKRPLKAYIADGIEANRVRTSSTFGFASVEADGTLSKIQVYGGFDQGTWQSAADRDRYASAQVKGLLTEKTKNSGLGENQADASLGVRSFNSIVLTNERRRKNGPLQLAANHGGRLIYLREVKASRLTLTEYVDAFVAATDFAATT